MFNRSINHATKLAFLGTALIGMQSYAATLYEIPTFLNAASSSSERFDTDVVTVNVASGVTGYSAVDIDANQTYQPANDTTLNANPRFGNNVQNAGGVIGGIEPGFIILEGTDEQYVEFEISASAPGTELDLSSLTFEVVRGTTGASVRSYTVDVAVDGGGFLEVADTNIVNNLNDLRNDGNFDVANIDLTGSEYQGIDSFTVRISELGGTIEITNLAINGEVVPEPGSLALLGLGGLCVLRRRRN